MQLKISKTKVRHDKDQLNRPLKSACTRLRN